MALPATDTFTHADGAWDPSPNWTVPTGGLSGHEWYANTLYINGQSGTWHLAYWSADAFDNNQYAKCTVPLIVGGGPAVRIQADMSCYFIDVTADTQVIRKVTTTTDAALGAALTEVIGANDVVELRAEGTTTVTLSYYLNGNLITTREDSSSPWTGGSPGFCGYSRYTQYDNWEGGNIGGEAPAQPDVLLRYEVRNL